MCNVPTQDKISLALTSPRSPCGERRPFPMCYIGAQENFNPRSPCGERLRTDHADKDKGDFNPRSPCGERRAQAGRRCLPLNFNPRSPCGERLYSMAFWTFPYTFQSTLPVWGATKSKQFIDVKYEISIHAPRVGSDFLLHIYSLQSLDFNPRSPGGERLLLYRTGLFPF